MRWRGSDTSGSVFCVEADQTGWLMTVVPASVGDQKLFVSRLNEDAACCLYVIFIILTPSHPSCSLLWKLCHKVVKRLPISRIDFMIIFLPAPGAVPSRFNQSGWILKRKVTQDGGFLPAQRESGLDQGRLLTFIEEITSERLRNHIWVFRLKVGDETEEQSRICLNVT